MSGADSDKLGVVLLHEHAKPPLRATPGAAGYDLVAAEPVTVAAGGRAVIRTGLQLSIPAGCYGRVAPRSGLAVRHCVDVAAGVVDSDYRGEVGVVLVNNGAAEFCVRAGDRVAQIILERLSTPEVEVVVSLDATDRGEGAFGSTGA